MQDQEFQVNITQGAHGWLATASDLTRHIPLLFVGPNESVTESLTRAAVRIEEYLAALAAADAGRMAQGLVPELIARPIQHTVDCLNRQAHWRAWHTLWPNYCKLCHAEGGDRKSVV